MYKTKQNCARRLHVVTTVVDHWETRTWLELSVFHIMLPVYVLPEHFPSKARQTICNNPKQTFTYGDGWKRNEGLKIEMLPMIVKSAKVIDSLFWWQYCEFGWERTAACGIRTDFHSVDRTLGVKENCGGLKYQSKCKGWWIFFCLYVWQNDDRWRQGIPGPFGIDWGKSPCT